MVKIKKVKMVTGFKGGTGKTMISTSLLIAAAKRNAKTILVDMNANNQDSIQIITNMYDDKFFISDKYKKWRFPMNETDKYIIAIKPDKPIWDAKKFWEFLSLILSDEEHSGSTVIVDTHPSIQHLLPEGNDDVKMFPEGIELEIYHVWDLAAPDKPEEMEAIDETIRKFKIQFKMSDKNFIHVFNPHSARSPRLFFSRSLRNKWNDFYARKVKEPIVISWATIKSEIESLDIEFNYKSEIPPSRLFDVWEPFFVNLLSKVLAQEECSKGTCGIMNVLPFFEYYDLSNFTTGQAYSKNRNIKGIELDLGKFYMQIEKFERLRASFNA